MLGRDKTSDPYNTMGTAPSKKRDSGRPAGLPPQTLRGLRDLIHSQPRDCEARPDLFFGPDDETDAEHSARVDAAREICADCPVRLACMAYALRNREEFGVWAGLD